MPDSSTLTSAELCCLDPEGAGSSGMGAGGLQAVGGGLGGQKDLDVGKSQRRASQARRKA